RTHLGFVDDLLRPAALDRPLAVVQQRLEAICQHGQAELRALLHQTRSRGRQRAARRPLAAYAVFAGFVGIPRPPGVSSWLMMRFCKISIAVLPSVLVLSRVALDSIASISCTTAPKALEISISRMFDMLVVLLL